MNQLKRTAIDISMFHVDILTTQMNAATDVENKGILQKIVFKNGVKNVNFVSVTSMMTEVVLKCAINVEQQVMSQEIAKKNLKLNAKIVRKEATKHNIAEE